MDLEHEIRDVIKEPQTVSRRKILKATGGIAVGRGSFIASNSSETSGETFDGTYLGQMTGIPAPDSSVEIAGRADITPFGKAVFDGKLCSGFAHFDEEKERGCLVINGKTTFTFVDGDVLEMVAARRVCGVSTDTQYDGSAENLAFNIVEGSGRFKNASGFASSAVNITNMLSFHGTLQGNIHANDC